MKKKKVYPFFFLKKIKNKNGASWCYNNQMTDQARELNK